MEKNKIDGWKLNTDYRRVLAVSDIAQDEILNDYEKVNLSLKILVKNKIKLWFLSFNRKCRLYEQIFREFVGRGKKYEDDNDSPPVFNIKFDEPTIYAGFRQAYNMDLRQIKYLHWYSFLDLLTAMPDDTQFKKIVAIRAVPVPQATKYNQKQIETLMKQKAMVALPFDRERSRERFNKSVFKLAETLKAWGEHE